MDSDLIKVNYYLEVQLGHEGTFGKVFEIPSLTFPINISLHPLGPIAQVVNFNSPLHA